MLNRINPCVLYFGLWVIQLLHIPLNLYGDGVSVVVLLIIYIWSLYYAYLVVNRYKMSSFLKSWTFLLVLFSIYGIIRIINPLNYTYNVGYEINSRMFIMEHWTSMLPIYPFYYYIKKGYLNEEKIKKWAFILIVVAIVNYFYRRSLLLIRYANLEDGFTNNYGYFIAMVLPLMFFWREKPLIQYLGIGLLMVFTALCVKRGAIVIGLISICLQIFYSINKQKKGKSFVTYLIVVGFIVLAYYFISEQISSNDYLNERLESTLEGDSSNRDQIFNDVIYAYLNMTNIFQKIFGVGADGSIYLIKSAAHNDWLEMLLSMGIVGLITFLFFWIYAFSERKKIINKDVRYMYMMVIIMLFIRTFISMSINDMYISTNIVLAYCLANSNKLYQSNNQINYVENKNSISNI